MNSFLDEITSQRQDIERKYYQWQEEYDENRSKLKQRVEWCQFLDDKYKVSFLLFFLKTNIQSITLVLF